MQRIIFIFVCCFLASGCAKKVYIQDEKLAIETANKFLKAIMQQSYQTAYDQYLSPGIKFGPKATADYFTADWEAIVEKYGKIQKATFESWQSVPGKRALQLYYLVVHEKVKKPVVYHLVLEGHQKQGYTLFIIDIGNEQQYPPNLQELPEKQKLNETIEVLP